MTPKLWESNGVSPSIGLSNKNKYDYNIKANDTNHVCTNYDTNGSQLVKKFNYYIYFVLISRFKLFIAKLIKSINLTNLNVWYITQLNITQVNFHLTQWFKLIFISYF